MLCITTRKATECKFMTTKGCSYKDKSCHPAVEACDGCDHIINIDEMAYCKSYPNPSIKWRYNICNFATHIKDENKDVSKINPLKASKRAATSNR